MAGKKFTINKESLLMEENEAYYLTRVPHSNMQMYLLLDKKRDVVSEDEKTLVAELKEETRRDIIMRSDRVVPKLDAVLSGRYQNDIVVMTPGELEKDYYRYEPSADPVIRARQEQERLQRQKQAADRYQQNKNVSKKEKVSQEKRGANNRENVKKQREPRQMDQKMKEQSDVKQQYYNKEQFQQIKLGVKRGLDVGLYSNILFNAEQMKELRMALKQGIDIRKYNNPVISAEHMRELRLGAENGVELSLSKLDQTQYNADQIHELRIGFEKGLNVNHYLNPSYTAKQMKEIRLGEQSGLDTTAYQSLHYTADQMKTMRVQLIFQRIKDVIQNLFQQAKQWLDNVLSQGATNVIEHMQSSMQNREARNTDQVVKDRLRDAVTEIKTDLINSELVNEEAYDDQVFEDIISRHVKSILQEYDTKDINMDQAAKHAAKDIMKEAGADMDQIEDKVLYSKTTEEAVDEVMAQQDEVIEEQFEMEM